MFALLLVLPGQKIHQSGSDAPTFIFLDQVQSCVNVYFPMLGYDLGIKCPCQFGGSRGGKW